MHHAEFTVSKPSQLTDSSCSRCMIRPGDDTWSVGGQPGHPLLGDKGSKLLPPASDDNCQSFRGKINLSNNYYYCTFNTLEVNPQMGGKLVSLITPITSYSSY